MYNTIPDGSFPLQEGYFLLTNGERAIRTDDIHDWRGWPWDVTVVDHQGNIGCLDWDEGWDSVYIIGIEWDNG